MTAFQIEDLPIESQMLTNALDEAQRKVEAYFFDIRKQLFEYDQVLNTQRDKVRGIRGGEGILGREDGALLHMFAERKGVCWG